MAILTTKEKADRYDALRVAIENAIEIYRRRQYDAKNNYKDASIIGAYNKGLADAYEATIQTLERFTN